MRIMAEEIDQEKLIDGWEQNFYGTSCQLNMETKVREWTQV